MAREENGGIRDRYPGYTLCWRVLDKVRLGPYRLVRLVYLGLRSPVDVEGANVRVVYIFSCSSGVFDHGV